MSPLVEFLEEPVRVFDENAVVGGVGNAFLPGEGVEIGVADLDRDTGSEFVSATQLVGQFHDHGGELVAQSAHVDGVGLKGALGADAFARIVGDHRPEINGVGLFPECFSVLSEFAAE